MQYQQQMQLNAQEWACIFALQLHDWAARQAADEAANGLHSHPIVEAFPAPFIQESEPMTGNKRPMTLVHSTPAPPSKKSKTIVYKGTVLLIDDDGWEWSKYGQKEIRQSSFAVRHYYRCKKKSCPARKHVQQTLTHPIQTTTAYYDDHTCCLEEAPVEEKKASSFEDTTAVVDASSSNSSEAAVSTA